MPSSQNFTNPYIFDYDISHKFIQKLGADISFSIDSGSSFKTIGNPGEGGGYGGGTTSSSQTGICINTRALLPTTYSVTFKDIKVSLWEPIWTEIKSFIFQSWALPFNDPSDNFVFDSEKLGVVQRGIFQRSCSDPTKYRAYKVYQAGRQTAYYPIYYFPDSSQIQINGLSLTPSYLANNNLNLDRKTGIFTSLNQDLTEKTFETDLYYKLVKVISPVSFTTENGAGVFAAGIDTAFPVFDKLQRLTVSFTLQDCYLAEDFQTLGLGEQNSAGSLSFIDLSKHQNDLQISINDYPRTETIGNSVIFSSDYSATSQPIRKITLGSKQLNLSDLNYWKTLYLATGGGEVVFDDAG